MIRGRTVVEIKKVDDVFEIKFGWFNQRHTKLRETSVKVNEKALKMLYDLLDQIEYDATLKEETRQGNVPITGSESK